MNIETFLTHLPFLTAQQKRDYIASLNSTSPSLVSFYRDERGLVEKYQLQPHPWHQHCYYFNPATQPLGSLIDFVQGRYYIQDPSSYEVAMALPPLDGAVILDLCAAPGGKSVNLVASGYNFKLLVANDVDYQRCLALKENLSRLGDPRLGVTNFRGEDDLGVEAVFDVVIVDAPCSLAAQFRRNPQALKLWTPQLVEKSARKQKELLRNAFRLVKTGGYIVYSTCTFTKEENEDVVADLLATSKASLVPIRRRPGMLGGVGMEEAVRLYPFAFPGEGHFIALIRKEEEATPFYKSWSPRRVGDAERRQVAALMADLGVEAPFYFADPCFYLSPPLPFQLPRVVSPGVAVCDAKGRVPDLDLARYLGTTCRHIELTNQQARLWVARNSCPVEGLLPGFYVVCYGGLPLSWGKVVGSTLKNHWPKYLRPNYQFEA